MLKSGTISKCIHLTRLNVLERAPTVVQWYEETTFTCLCMISSKVTFHMESGQLDCQCGENCYFCIHRLMVLWFFHQTDQLKSSIKEVNENMMPDHFTSDGDDNIPLPQKPMVFGEFIYPPEDSTVLSSMFTHLKNEK